LEYLNKEKRQGKSKSKEAKGIYKGVLKKNNFGRGGGPSIIESRELSTLKGGAGGRRGERKKKLGGS